jgi:hypothetical protein
MWPVMASGPFWDSVYHCVFSARTRWSIPPVLVEALRRDMVTEFKAQSHPVTEPVLNTAAKINGAAEAVPEGQRRTAGDE